MFEYESRYYNLETVTYRATDGREHRYKCRRFLPRSEDLELLVEVTATEGDRLDLITARQIGDPELFWQVCDANDAMNPFDLVVPGRVLRIPEPQAEE